MEAITRKVLYGPRSSGDNEKLASVDDVEDLKAFIKENMTQDFHSRARVLWVRREDE